MGFYSILYPTPEAERQSRDHPWLLMGEARPEGAGSGYEFRGNKLVPVQAQRTEKARSLPIAFIDLKLDQVVEAVLCREQDQPLWEAFYHPCASEEMARFRQQVVRSLEQEEVFRVFSRFCGQITQALRELGAAQGLHAPSQRDQCALDAALKCFDALRALAAEEDSSWAPGLQAFGRELRAWVAGAAFAEAEGVARAASERMARIGFRIILETGSVRLEFAPEARDFTAQLRQSLASVLKEEAVLAEEEIRLFGQAELCPLESLILGRLEARNQEAFRGLREAVQTVGDPVPPFVRRFVQELPFYLRYVDFMRRMEERGVHFCYPELVQGRMELMEARDLALALKQPEVVPSDLALSDGEAGVLVTGANQGGKTTFARAVGQCTLLAALGLPVACRQARLPLYRRVFSQFSEPEDAQLEAGKLREELTRLKPVLRFAGSDSLVVLNELFASTTAQDALEMSARTLEQLCRQGARVVCVTHGRGLSRLCPELVCLVAQVDEADGRRLYRMVRASADGAAYAASIAHKFNLSRQAVRRRVCGEA